MTRPLARRVNGGARVPSVLHRATALVLSWVFTASSVWAAAPLPAPPAARAEQPWRALWSPSAPAEGGGSAASALRAGLLPLITTAAVAMIQPPAPSPSPATASVEVFGRQRYVRTTGPKNEYTTAVTVPAWVMSPFLMRIWNGEANGTYRVSSAWVAVNGTQATAAPADFNQNVYTLDRAVTLTPQTTLKVTLASKPTSYLSIGLFGTNADHTAPRVRVELPAPGSIVNDATPGLRVRYEDLVGAGEPAASGIDVSTLRIDVDGNDRTTLFTRRNDEATAEWPDALALSPGTHEVRVHVKDNAGNEGQAVATFRVDLTRPVVEVTDPAAGSFLPATTPRLRVTYGDDVELDLSSLKVLINGVDRTVLFIVGAAEATAQLEPATALPPGVNTVQASIRDRGGNAASASTSFHVDVEPPTLAIGEPLSGSRSGSADLRVVVHYGDDQELDYATFAATLDGAPLLLAQGPTGALGFTGPLTDGGHELIASIRDRAGHRREAASSFTVDTTVPEIAVVSPPSGALLNTNVPEIALAYRDVQGVDHASLRLMLDGQTRTAWCVTTDTTASCPVAEALADGTHGVEATIADLTGNAATAKASFVVDTVPPTATLVEPLHPVDTAAPTLRFAFADVGVGVDATAVEIRVDGAPRTFAFAISDAGAVGVVAGLADGSHTVEVRLRDLAWNQTVITAAFVVDTTRPALAIVSPAPDSFVSDTTPAIVNAWSDADGSGMATGTARLFLRSGDGAERDVSAWLTSVTVSGATGEVPAADALADGTHHLRAVVADVAGNVSQREAAFVVDTVRPTYAVDRPAKGSFVATTTPRFVIQYQDERSGVSLGDLRLRVDGVDRTARLDLGAEEASGTLTAAEALAQGPHGVEVTVKDRAGNEATPVPHTFTVDTVPPVAAVVLPAEGAYLGEPRPLLRVTYSDADVGASSPVASVQVFVDDVERTAAFAVGPVSAEATLAEDLGEGRHRVRVEVLDWAANPAAMLREFNVDTAAPTVTVSAPEEGSYHRASPVTFSGTVADADPQTSASCATPSASAAAALATAGEGSSTFSCAVPLAEGENTVTVTARDRLAHEGSASRTVVLDTVKPQVTIVQPTRGEYTNASEITVSGGVVDTSPVTLKVNGVEASISGGAFSATVPVGAGPEVALTAVAEDAAGNTGQDEVSVRVDRTNPVVHITSPTAGAYVKGPVLDVTGTVADESPVSLLDVNGVMVEVSGGSFTARIPVADGVVTLVATARDAAGNPGTDTVSLVVDSGPPIITITEPAPDTITNATQVRVSGTVQDATEVTLVAGGTPIAVAGGSFSFDAPLGNEGRTVISLSAIDRAGNASSAEVAVVRDTIAPNLTIVSPAPDAVVGALPVIVQGLVQDATEVGVTVDGSEASRTGAAWQASFASMAEGPHTFAIIATDQAGNTTTLSRDVVMDLGPPVVAITAPAPSTLTRASSIAVTGTVEDRSTVTVSIELPSGAAIPAVVQRTAANTYAFTAASVGLVEGDNRLVARATDASGRSAEAAVTVTRDSTPPQVALTAPDAISRGRGGEATATATDAIAVAQVRLTAAVSATCTVGESLTGPPYTLPLIVPACAKAGGTIVVTATATDTAGNSSTTSRGVRVLSDGVVVGQVLDDATGRPLAGATVTLIGSSQASGTRTTDETGGYSISTGDLGALIVTGRSGMTSVERELTVESGVGTVPVDARLTSLAEPAFLAAGDPHTAGPVTVTGPAGTYQLTPLSAQGLPGLLPLGWSPLAAFDLRADTAGPFSATAVVPVPNAGSAPGLHLAHYSAGLHAWVMDGTDVTAAPAAPGTLTVTATLSQPGAYAVVAADAMDPPIVVAAVGQPLTGTDAVLLAATVTTRSVVDPATLPPSGGLSTGTLTVVSPVPLPSGTVVQTEVTETFTLASGDVASEDTRRQDIVVFRAPVPPAVTVPDPPPAPGTELHATLPITPTRSFTSTELVEGKVHLDILAGRESVRGKTGGSEAVVAEDGDAQLAVPAHALAEDTAIWMAKTPLTAGLPSDAGLTPISEVAIDFAGNRLGLAAELSVSASGLPTDGTYVIARQTRVDGIVRLEIVSMAAITGERLVSRAHPGFTGVVGGGRFVFYRIAAAVGFLAGRVSSSAGPQRGAVIEATGLPFIALSAADGAYAMVAVAGAITATAKVPRSSLAGSGSATVVPGETATLDIALVGVVSTATVTPADGTTAILTNAQVAIVAPIALQPASVTAQNVRLLITDAPTATPIPVRLVLSSSGKVLAVVPETALAFSTTYRLEVVGLVDVFGGLVNVPTTSFTTKDDTPPVYNLNALTFSFPDADGLVRVSLPAGSLPPGTTILIINAGNGHVLSFTVGNDGGAEDTLPATISDRLLVTITDPFGNVTTFERSQFVNPATGETAVGPGGGVVTATDGSGVELRIPADATDKGVTLKIAGLTAADLQTEFPDQQPDLAGATLASGLKIESPDQPTFKKEVDLVFPKPADAPDGAFYYVYRRIARPDGTALFETIDHAFVECPAGQTTCAEADKKVVTASWPFGGYATAFGAFDPSGALVAVTSNYVFLMWTFDSLLPRLPLAGVVTGKVIQAGYASGGSGVTFLPVHGAVVAATDAAGDPLLTGNAVIATTPPADPVPSPERAGRFTLFDPRYIGGTVEIAAARNGATPGPCPAVETPADVTRCTTAFEANPAEWSTSGLRFYRNIASGNVTFPATAPPAPPPAIAMRLYRKATATDPRLPVTGGMVAQDTPLELDLDAGFARLGDASLSGRSCVVQYLDPLQSKGRIDLEQGDCAVSVVGTYRYEATAIPGLGSPVSASVSFLVIAPGGGNTTSQPGVAPTVVSRAPRHLATGIATNALPQATFSEPVSLGGRVSIVTDDAARTPVAVQVLGITRTGQVLDVTASDEPVTSITIKPLGGLSFSEGYAVALDATIIDTDTDPAPLNTLTDGPWTFTTFGPESVGGTEDTFGSPGIAVMGDRAYLVENGFSFGTVKAFDVSDPVAPQEIESARASVTWRPVDVAGAEEQSVTAGRLLAVATGPTNQSKPSNLYLFDVSSDAQTRWIGAASLTGSAMEGFINRIAVHNGFAYAATQRKGIQVVDLARARDNFQGLGTQTIEYWNAVRAFNTDGQGWGHDAVAQTIAVRAVAGSHARLLDIDVADFTVEGASQPIALATGEIPLVVVNPQTARVYPAVAIATAATQTAPAAALTYGYAMGLGTAGTRRLAVIAGSGTIGTTARPVVAVVDVSLVDSPVVLSILDLSTEPCLAGIFDDVLIVEDRALIGAKQCAGIVNLGDPLAPVLAGTVTGVGGRLAMDASGLLYSTARSVFGGTNALGGVRTAALGSLALIQKVSPAIVPVDAAGRTTEPLKVTYRLIAPPEDLGSAQINVLRDTQVIGGVPATELSHGTFEIEIPAGLAFSPPSERLKIRVGSADAAPVLKGIESLADDPPNGTFAFRPSFETLSPSSAVAGVTEIAVTINGANMSALARVFVRNVNGEWNALDTITRAPDSVTVRLPATLLSQPGFLQVSPFEDDVWSLAFLVSEVGLPAPSTGQGFTISAVAPEELGAGGANVVLEGQGFVEGMSVVVGRTGTSARTRLLTTFTSDAQLEAQLPPGYLGRAADLYVAALSVDGAALSPPRPVTSSQARQPVNYAALFSPGEAVITAVHGEVIWNEDAQDLLLEGIGLATGMPVFFQAGGTTATTTTAASSVPASTPAAPPLQATTVTVRVPNVLTRWPRYCLTLDTDPSRMAPSAPRCIAAQPPAFLPVGGRLKFAAYSDPTDDSRVYVIPEADPARGDLSQLSPTCAPRGGLPVHTLRRLVTVAGNRVVKIAPAQVTYAFSPPTIPHPFTPSMPAIPLVEREGNRCDADSPDVFYLRGVRSAVGSESLTIRATFADPSGTMRRGEVEVIVAEGEVGPQVGGWKVEAAVQEAGARAGIPPQLLKAQVGIETNFNPEVYRYEPITIDQKNVSGDGSPRARDDLTYGQYIRRHMLPGTAVLPPVLTPSGATCVAVLGPNATPDPATTQGCVAMLGGGAAASAPLQVRSPDVVIVSRQGLPGSSGYGPQTGVSASRFTPGPAPVTQALGIVETSRWSIRSGTVNAPAPSTDEFRFDYTTNEVLLGRALTDGEWVILRYYTVPVEPILPGGCGVFDARTLIGRTGTHLPRLTFQNGDSVGEWLRTNLRDFGKGFLTGTRAEKSIDFRYHPQAVPPGALNLVIDGRLRAATAQFLAAGSFGLAQATINDWLTPAKIPVLNRAFNLTGRCLQDLGTGPTRERDALHLAAASHSYGRTLSGLPATTGVRDQIDWAQYWSAVFEKYNAFGEKYCKAPTSNQPCSLARNGISDLVRNRYQQYAPR